MNVVFLDIDGVLNSHDWYKRRPSRERPINEIDPDAAARVQRLCDETGASIVVSSTWRLIHQLNALRSVFKARGLTAPVIGKTPGHNNDPRGLEIQRWLDAARLTGTYPDGMVILDDDSDMVHLTPWLVRTPFETGFIDAHILDAKCVMKQPMPSNSPATKGSNG
jgi:hypothetical protein